jgi:hypothetical protein
MNIWKKLFSVVLWNCFRILCGPVERGMTRQNPRLVTCIIIYSNVGICNCLLTGMKMHHWRDLFATKERMWLYWRVICLRFAFVVRSLGVALCWNSKDYWCQMAVPARTFLATDKPLVFITILIWCLPRIYDILLLCTSMQRQLTADWGQPASSLCPTYCTSSKTCLCTYQQVNVCFSVLNLISQ